MGDNIRHSSVSKQSECLLEINYSCIKAITINVVMLGVIPLLCRCRKLLTYLMLGGAFMLGVVKEQIKFGFGTWKDPSMLIFRAIGSAFAIFACDVKRMHPLYHIYQT